MNIGLLCYQIEKTNQLWMQLWLTSSEMFTEVRGFPIVPDKEGLMMFHLHFFCPGYIGLDFTVPVSMRVKPESQKPKVEINKKDLELDKEKGLMDVKMRKKNDE